MDYLFHILVFIGIYGILAGSLNLVAGITGMLSITHAAFFGVGAYATALLSLHAQTPFLFNLFAGSAVSVLVSVVVIVPSLRLNDDYFAMATFGFQMILFSIFNNWIEVTRGPMGLPGIPKATLFGHELSLPLSCFVTIAILGALSFFVFRLISVSSFGRILRAIREDEVFVQSLGKNVWLNKMLIFIVAAAFAGLAGGFYAQYITFINPTSFTVLESILLISMVIIGGAGNIWGSIIGTAFLIILPEALRFLGMPSAIAANMRQIIYGAMLVLCMLYRPQGFLGEYSFDK
jgi:branched-chain amino acid transport system permease protein